MEKSKETPVTKEVKSLPVFAVFTHCISDFFDFILHIRCDLVHIGYSAIYQLSTLIINMNNETAAIVNSVAGSITAMGALYLIIIWPIEALIGTFILTAIVALLYNFLAPIIGGIKLELQ